MPAYNYPQEVCELFTEYTDMLIKGDPSFEAYLEVQNYDGELKNLQEKYGLPYGRLYLAFSDGEPAGCIGLKRLDNSRKSISPSGFSAHRNALSSSGRSMGNLCLPPFPVLSLIQIFSQLMSACSQLLISRNAGHDKLALFSAVHIIKCSHVFHAAL